MEWWFAFRCGLVALLSSFTVISAESDSWLLWPLVACAVLYLTYTAIESIGHIRRMRRLNRIIRIREFERRLLEDAHQRPWADV